MNASMNLQSIKIKFIEEFSGLNNEILVNPIMEEEYLNKAITANVDIREGRIISHENLVKESANW